MEGDSRFRCKEDNARLGQRLEAASACVEALQHELAVLQQALVIRHPWAVNTNCVPFSAQLHDKAKDGLQSKTGSEEVAVQRAAQVRPLAFKARKCAFRE
eukprot:scaffold52521_cov19-Tisochrysis_lutea.AAC.1